jgi:hypothetical protein
MSSASCQSFAFDVENVVFMWSLDWGRQQALLWQPLAARTSAKQLEFILLKQRRVIRSFA